MRNLKKVLALVLALVMSLSLVTIANAADFSDDADIDYSEAVDVMVAAGIIDGVGNNSFDPNGTLTREQAAKLITYMLMGENSDKLGIESSSFKDVAVTRWSAPAIEYCASLGIIDGAGDGNFYPAGKLTGYAFAKMLLTAIGYDSQIEKFTGNGWTIPVATIGLEVGLNKGMDKMFGSAEITRQEAAQMALNAIKAPLVEYNKQATITVNGAEVNVGSASAQYVTTTIAKDQNISDRELTNSSDNTPKYTVEFGEKYLPKLELKRDSDDFGRPSYIWYYDKEEIGSYINTELLVDSFTAAIEYQDLYKSVGSNAAKNFDLDSFVDGADGSVEEAKITKNNDEEVPDTDRGALTQVFVDVDNKLITVTTINTWLAQAATDYSASTGKVTLNVYTDRQANGDEKIAVKRLNDEDFPAIADLKEDDYVTVTMAKGVVKTIGTPEITADVTISSYSSKPSDGDAHNDEGGRLKKVVVSGTTYNISAKAYYDSEYLYDYDQKKLKDFTYDLILDQYGYLLGIKNVTSDEDFFFVVGYEDGSSYLAQTVDKALVIFPDGTMKTVDVMEKKTSSNQIKIGDAYRANAWYNYTVNKDGVYVISGLTDRQVAEVRIDDIDSKNTTIATTKTIGTNTNEPDFIFGNSDSVYISVETGTDVNVGGSIVKTLGVSTGIKNTSIDPQTGLAYDKNPANILGGSTADVAVYNVFALYNKSGYVTYAVVIGEDGSVNDRFVYLTSGITSKAYDSEVDDYIYTYDAIVDGQMTEVKSLVSNDTSGTSSWLAAHNLYKASYDADGYITDMEKMGENNSDDAGNDGVYDAAHYNTKTYQDSGFGLKEVGFNTDYTNAGSRQKVTLKGAVLYLGNTATNDNYVVLAEDAKFFVDGEDDTDGEYNEYGNAASALAALGYSNELTSTANTKKAKFVVICDKTTGFGTTVIMKDYYYEELDDGTGGGGGGGVAGYVLGNIGSSTNSLNVQVLIGALKEDGSIDHWLTAKEIEDLNLTEDDIAVRSNGTKMELAKGLGEMGSVYNKGTGNTQGSKYQYAFDKSAIAVFDAWAFDGYASGNAGKAETLYPGAGFLKIHLGSKLEAGALSVWLNINGTPVTYDVDVTLP